MSTGDFRPTASWQNLRLRAELLRKVREFFHERGFLEVETPILSQDTVVDRHLDPFAVSPNLWLQTSPEFGMKRLMAAGAEAIYQISRVFRREEQGTLHNPEFTMIEWYRAGDSLAEGMQFTSDLCEATLSRGPATRLSYREAMLRHVGLDPHTATVESLAATARQGGTPPPETLAADDRDGWLDWLLVDRVQPHLGVERPTLVHDYPASQAALARIRPGATRGLSQFSFDENGTVPLPAVDLAERFELYVSGIELANGYQELLDAGELRRRNARANAQRSADGKSPLSESSRLLAAMEAGLPECVGVALGLDRLLMLAAGAKTLAEVIAFPFDRA